MAADPTMPLETVQEIEHSEYQGRSAGRLLSMRRSVIQIALREPGLEENLGLNTAQALLSEARLRADEVFHRARERGMFEGTRMLRSELSAFQSARAETLLSAADEIAELALFLASEVLAEAVRLQPESLKNRLIRAADLLRQDSALTARVHPEDHRWLKKLEEELSRAHGVRLISDNSISKGSARLVSDTGSWELDPAEHMRRVQERLRSGAPRSGETK